MSTEGIYLVAFDPSEYRGCGYCGSKSLAVYDIERDKDDKVCCVYVSGLCPNHVNPEHKPEGVYCNGELAVFNR